MSVRHYEVRIYGDAEQNKKGVLVDKIFSGDFDPDDVVSNRYGSLKHKLDTQSNPTEDDALGWAVACAFKAHEIDAEMESDTKALTLARHWYGNGWDDLSVTGKRDNFLRAQRHLRDLKVAFKNEPLW